MTRTGEQAGPQDPAQRKRLDRPDADTSGQYGSLDDRLGYGSGRDPGNLGEEGRETTTHNYREDDARDEGGSPSGSRPAETDHQRPSRPGDPRR